MAEWCIHCKLCRYSKNGGMFPCDRPICEPNMGSTTSTYNTSTTKHIVTQQPCPSNFDVIYEDNSTIKVKRLNSNAQLPTRGSNFAAGYDLYACIDDPITIEPHQTVKIGTGLAFELQENTFGAIFARSGIATKQGLRPANCVGICDSDYRGEYIISIHNDSDTNRIIEPNQRIAQLVIMPFIPVKFSESEILNETDRGSSGFGSTGI